MSIWNSPNHYSYIPWLCCTKWLIQCILIYLSLKGWLFLLGIWRKGHNTCPPPRSKQRLWPSVHIRHMVIFKSCMRELSALQRLSGLKGTWLTSLEQLNNLCCCWLSCQWSCWAWKHLLLWFLRVMHMRTPRLPVKRFCVIALPIPQPHTWYQGLFRVAGTLLRAEAADGSSVDTLKACIWEGEGERCRWSFPPLHFWDDHFLLEVWREAIVQWQSVGFVQWWASTYLLEPEFTLAHFKKDI